MEVAIRADGGPDRGIGHLVRSGVLAKRFLEEGWKVTYLTETPDATAEVAPCDVGVYQLDSQSPQHDAVEWIKEADAEVVISDCYEVGTPAQEAMSAVTDCFVILQYDNRHELCCDILVNGHLFGPEIDYQWKNSEPTWCVGVEYVLLRNEFQKLANQETTWRDPPETALITMGGSDVTNTTPAAMRAFDGVDIEVDVIIGPGFDNQTEITNVASEVSSEFNLFNNPPDLPTRMLRADVAISGFGTTAYELLAVQTPFVGIPVVDNQNRTARAFEARSLAETAISEDSVREKVRTLVRNSEKRHTLFERYDTIIDGNGVERIFEKIQSTVTQR